MAFTTLRTYEIEPLPALQEIRIRGTEELRTTGETTLEGIEILFHGPTLLSQVVLQVADECAPRLYAQHPSGLRYAIHTSSGSVEKFVINSLNSAQSFVYWAKFSAGCRLFLSAANGSSGDFFDLSLVVEPLS